MKARVKATGETIEIMQVYEKGESSYVRLDMLDTTEVRYHISELEFEGFETPASSNNEGGVIYIDPSINYWTRLEHTYAGMAMQGILSNPEVDLDYKSDECMPQAVAATAYNIAHALVEKLKEKETK